MKEFEPIKINFSLNFKPPSFAYGQYALVANCIVLGGTPTILEVFFEHDDMEVDISGWLGNHWHEVVSAVKTVIKEGKENKCQNLQK